MRRGEIVLCIESEASSITIYRSSDRARESDESMPEWLITLSLESLCDIPDQLVRRCSEESLLTIVAPA